MSLSPSASFRMQELVLRFEPDDAATWFQVRASLNRYEFTKPEPVNLTNWPPKDADLGTSIGNVLFPENSATREQVLLMLKHARDVDSWLRIVFEFPTLTDPTHEAWVQLVGVPWERVAVQIDDGGAIRALGRHKRVSIVRAMPDAHGEVAVDTERGSSRTQMGAKPRYRHIGVFFNRPRWLTEEVAEADEWFEVSNVKVQSVAELEGRIREASGDLTVVHVTAHGDEHGIPFGTLRATPESLRSSLTNSRLKLLLLSVCHSANAGGLVSLLPTVDLPAFIAMQESMLGGANSEFVGELFRALKQGQSIDEAVWTGRDAASQHGDSWWWVPAVYLSRDTRKSPWLWSPQPAAEEPTAAQVVAPAAVPSDHPLLPVPQTTFEVNPNSSFIEFPGGLVEIYPGCGVQQGLYARRVHQGDEQKWKSRAQVSSVAVDSRGRYVACAADGKFMFAPVSAPRVLEREWVVAERQLGEVSVVHEVTEFGRGGVEATVTLNGAVRRVRVSERGTISAPTDVEAPFPAGTIADTAHGLTVSLRIHGATRSIVVEYQGQSRVFRAPEGAIGVNVVRHRHGAQRAPDFVIRTKTQAALWNSAALSPTLT